MPTARRTRTIRATPAEVWAVVADPYHLPRWWPKVSHVENVTPEAFTQLLRTVKGSGVRADFRVTDRTDGQSMVWEQELEGTPFERLLTENVVRVAMSPDGDGTRVAIEMRQRLRGLARLAPWMVRGAAKRTLDEALDSLSALF